MVYERSLRFRRLTPSRRTAVLLLIVLGLPACDAKSGEERAAFAAAAAAVSDAAKPEHPALQYFQFRRRTGLKGSRAVVVCGEMRSRTVLSEPDITPFIYIWKLDPAVSDPKRRQGEVIVLPKLDRRAIGELAAFCGSAESPVVTDWTYFN